jgi:DNA polymerase IIIc chi subunit
MNSTMTKISCYQTQADDLAKTFCKLTEKCYESGKNSVVITENTDFSNSLDRSLWTYSKKHFIPHGTTSDPRPEDHSVFITTKIENPNNSEIAIFVNPSKEIILEALTPDNQVPFLQIKKIIFLFDDTQKTQTPEISHIIATSKISKSEIQYFIKTNNGSWKETSIA